MNESTVTDRQRQIVKALVEDFINEAEAVGSEDLVKKYGFDFSPATMRNEMAELTRKGFLHKDHVSAGRQPTPLAFRYYIKNLMDEKELPVVNEVAMKQRVWDQRHDLSYLLHETAQALADELQNLTIVSTQDGHVYAAGAAHILRHPEFYDIDLTRNVLHLIDQYDLLNAIMHQLSDDAEFGIILGDEIGMSGLNQCGLVVSRVTLPGNQVGYISVIGPYRLNYPNVIPAVKYLQNVINEITRSW